MQSDNDCFEYLGLWSVKDGITEKLAIMMNARATVMLQVFSLLLCSWCFTLHAATLSRAYPADPSGHGLGFTQAPVDKLGRLVVFGDSSGGPTGDNSIRVFDGTKWTYLWPKGYTNGGPQVRHNHVSFYVDRLDEFWLWGGSHLETLPGALRSGRFSLHEKRWIATSTNDSGAFNGLIRGRTVFLSTMSAAWSAEADMGMLFGGSVQGNATNGQWIIEPNPPGPEPYRIVEFSGQRPPIGSQCMNCMVAVGLDFYLFGGTFQQPGGPYVNRKVLWKFDSKKRTWIQLRDAPVSGYQPVLTYDSKANSLVAWANDRILVYDIAAQNWSDQTPVGLPCAGNHVGGYLTSINAHLYEGGNDCRTGNSRGPGVIGISLGTSASPAVKN
jgi:hypothetical protein